MIVIGLVAMTTGCARFYGPTDLAALGLEAAPDSQYDYVIGPGDRLNIFVWRNPDVSSSGIPVRPDGKISTPLIEDLVAAGKTPSQLAREMEAILAEYIKEPLITITVVGFVGVYSDQIRVVGEAGQPQALSYSDGMTLLDVMIAVGGLTDFAAGNRATLVRRVDGEDRQARLRIDDLIRGGDISANIRMQPGDIIIIPESYF